VRYYPAVLERAESGGYGVVLPDFPGCVSAGDTIQSALTNAGEALTFHIEGMAEDGDTVPEPSELDAPLPDWLGRMEGTRVLVAVEEPGGHVRVNVSLPTALVERIDRIAGTRQRSRFLADAAIRALRERAGTE
jgi:predicted RNase H-like HicB family nuclease